MFSVGALYRGAKTGEKMGELKFLATFPGVVSEVLRYAVRDAPEPPPGLPPPNWFLKLF